MKKSLVSESSLQNSLTRVIREVNALARNHNPEKASWKAVRRAVLEAATGLRIETNQTVPYVKVTKIAKLRRIYRIVFFHDSAAPEAVLVPELEGFILRLPAGRPRVRYRTSIAHEIGHTFFYDLSTSPPIRLLAWGPSGVLSQKEEDICKAFAREL